MAFCVATGLFGSGFAADLSFHVVLLPGFFLQRNLGRICPFLNQLGATAVSRSSVLFPSYYQMTGDSFCISLLSVTYRHCSEQVKFYVKDAQFHLMVCSGVW